MKVAVEIVEARDLKPNKKRSNTAPSTYVEVSLAGQAQRTQTKPNNDPNPTWNETLVFHVADPLDLPSLAVEITVYTNSTSLSSLILSRRSLLGHVSISGSSLSPSRSDAALLRCPLEKRGEIAIRLYAVTNSPARSDITHSSTTYPSTIHKNSVKTSKSPRVYNSVASSTKTVTVEDPVKKAQPEPEHDLVETHPPLAAWIGYKKSSDKITTTYDLVEQMQYLFVHVVKARDLPPMDITTGSLDPYVKVRVGNYGGETKKRVANKNPEWNQVFAFAGDHIHAQTLEVVVMDKDILRDDFVGKVVINLTDVQTRVPPDSPLAPMLYRLSDKNNEMTAGSIMMAVWNGTQADEAYPEAWHSDANNISLEGVHTTKSKVYFTPRLSYLRVDVLAAQDLAPSESGRVNPEVYVRLRHESQTVLTRLSPDRSLNPTWKNEEKILVAREPFDEPLYVSVFDRVGPNKDVSLGELVLAKKEIGTIGNRHQKMPAKWFKLGNSDSKGKIQLRVYYDTRYHVMDEVMQYSSDFRPSNKQLRKPAVGVLDVGILSARNLLPVKISINGKTNDATANAYCVAKYGPKWIRTRTCLNSLAPRWNEQYTWEVFDPCTVLTVAVFDNCQVNGNGSDKDNDLKDHPVGKVRIRLSTLESGKTYTHYHPLLLPHPTGLKRTGELHLAVRFTSTAWFNMVLMYVKPLLPKEHYARPMSVAQMTELRQAAANIIVAKLARSEPPLRREAVEYVLETKFDLFSMRRSKGNWQRIAALFSTVKAVAVWLDGVQQWKDWITSCLVILVFLVMAWMPVLILPTVFFYLLVIGLWNYRYRPRRPAQMASYAEQVAIDDLDEEFDVIPSSRPVEVVKQRYDRLRHVAGRVQTVVGDLAAQGERAQALLTWRDPRASMIFVVMNFVLVFVFYKVPFKLLVMGYGLYQLRHPKFRSKRPSVPFNFFRRLPPLSDVVF
ncbi:FT-interacting protein 7-like [Typha angustifolia]|uniref:FT-interacting protein 7-like n=1 Tax=Typha angustifolia TaxID=59011 RepID=UPI003C30277C